MPPGSARLQLGYDLKTAHQTPIMHLLPACLQLIDSGMQSMAGLATSAMFAWADL